MTDEINVYGRGLMGRCPRCGRGKLFNGFMTLKVRCDQCELSYSFARSDDGAAVFVILIGGFIVVGAALTVELKYEPPFWVHAMLWGPLILCLTLGLLRSFKGVFICLQYRYKAGEGGIDSTQFRKNG